MKSNLNFGALVISLLVAVAGIYWYVSSGTGNQPPLSADEPDTETQFQTLVGELTPISFNTAIFSDARFAALVDLTTPIAPEPSGRLDPFAAMSVNGK